MHYTRVLEGLEDLEYLQKKPIYKSKESKYAVGLFCAKLSESKCCIKKQYMNHWLFETMKSEFLVENNFSWETHPINITNVHICKKNYNVLAESESNPIVVEHLNTVACQFYISKKYP